MAFRLPTLSTQMQRHAKRNPLPPVGGGPPGAHGPIKMSPKQQQIMRMQRFLNSRGYHVSVDGVVGPQTKAAVKDWHTGPKHRPLLNKHNEATKIVLDGKNPPKGPKAPKGRVGGAGGGRGGGTTASPAKAPPGGGFQTIDPAAYAASAANEAYNPIIAELLNQQKQTQAQGGQNIADISSWFGQLENTRQRSAAGDQAALAEAVANNQKDISGIAGLFGQSGGHDLANTAANNLAGIRAQGKATTDFDSHMAAVLAAQGVDARIAAQHATSATLQELGGKIVAQRGAKGQAYQRALQEGRGQKLQQQAAIQNMQLAELMAPVQLATAKANLASTKTQSQLAIKQAEIAGKQAALQDKVTQAQLAQFKKSQQGGGAVPFKDLQAGDRLKLSATISKAVRDNVLAGARAGGYQSNHRAWGAIKSLLSPYDIKNPEVKQFALGILRLVSKKFVPGHFH